jgi:hypothetical protein
MDACCDIVIARPRAFVADLLFDPLKARLWSSGVVSSRLVTPGPVKPGTRIEQISRVFGLKTIVTYEVVSMAHDQFLEIKVTGPFDTWCLHEVEDHPGGTLVRIRTAAVGGDPGFFQRFGWLLRALARYNLRRDLRRLKRLAETGAV